MTKSAFCSSVDIHEMNFTVDELDLILNPRVKGRQYHRFSDGTVYREGCVIKRAHNAKFGKVAGTKGTIAWKTNAKYVGQEFIDQFCEDAHWVSERMKENKLIG